MGNFEYSERGFENPRNPLTHGRNVKILVSNDDGYLATGITTLADELSEIGDVVVFAPDRNHSGASNSLTLHAPLRVHQVVEGRYFVNGTPTDCVHLALSCKAFRSSRLANFALAIARQGDGGTASWRNGRASDICRRKSSASSLSLGGNAHSVNTAMANGEL